MCSQAEDVNDVTMQRLSDRGLRNLQIMETRTRRQAVQYSNDTSITRIDLSTAENSLIRPEILEICRRGLPTALKSENMSARPGFSGDPALRDAFADTLNTYFKPVEAVDQSHIVIGPGGAHCITALLYNICDEGDGVLIPAPYWHGFDFHCRRAAGVVPVPAIVPDLESALSEDSLLSSLRSAWEQSTINIKVLLLTNPHNPLGQRYSRTTLEALMRFCSERNFHLISDEVYALTSVSSHSSKDFDSFNSVLSIDVKSSSIAKSMVHVVWSLSKDFGLASVKMGCIITQYNSTLVDSLRFTNHMHTSSLSCEAAKVLLTSPELPELIRMSSKRLGESYNSLITLFERYNIPYIKSIACPFVFAKLAPNASSPEDEANMIEILRKEGVLVSRGAQYHLPSKEYGWARVGFAMEQSNFVEGIRRLNSVLGRSYIRDMSKNE